MVCHDMIMMFARSLIADQHDRPRLEQALDSGQGKGFFPHLTTFVATVVNDRVYTLPECRWVKDTLTFKTAVRLPWSVFPR